MASSSHETARALGAFGLGAALGLMILIASSGGDVDAMVYGDGVLHRYVAEHITQPPDEVAPHVEEVGTSLRYGRIGLPATIWLLSAGQAEAMRFAHPAIMVLAAGAAAAAVATLFPRAPAGVAALVFAVPGFTLALDGGYAEVLALGLALWGLVATIRGNPLLAGLFFGVAILTKENAGALLLGTVIWRFSEIWRLSEGRRRDALIPLWGMALPVVWHVAVWTRYGHLPLLDPYLSGPTGLGAPGEGLISSLADPFGTDAFVAAIVHVVIGAAIWLVAKRSVFALAGAVASLQLLSMSRWTWRFSGDGVRVSTFLEATILLAVLAILRPGWTDGRTLRRATTAGEDHDREPVEG